MFFFYPTALLLIRRIYIFIPNYSVKFFKCRSLSEMFVFRVLTCLTLKFTIVVLPTKEFLFWFLCAVLDCLSFFFFFFRFGHNAEV